MSIPSGFGRGLQRALRLESVKLEQPAREPGPSWLLNPRRLEVVLTAAAYPGVHLRSAARLLVSPLPSLRFHVARLSAHGLLRTRRLGNRVLLFLPGQFPPRMEPLLAAWEDPLDRRVLEIIRMHPGIHRTVLGRLIVPDARILDRALGRLQRIGAVRSRGRRGRGKFWVTAAWNRFEIVCRESAADRLQVLLDLLESEGLHPLLDELTPDRARISVDGPRSRIRFSLPLNPLSPVSSSEPGHGRAND